MMLFFCLYAVPVSVETAFLAVSHAFLAVSHAFLAGWRSSALVYDC